MPRRDGTGPMGEGPMTGRGMGICAGYSHPGYMGSGRGWFGIGRGGRAWSGGRDRGRGWWGAPGWGRTPYPACSPPAVEDEKKYVNEEIKALQAELDDLKKYLGELEKEKK